MRAALLIALILIPTCERPEETVDRGLLALEQGDTEEAVRLLAQGERELPANHPSSLRCRYGLCLALARYEPTTSVDAFEELLSSPGGRTRLDEEEIEAMLIALLDRKAVGQAERYLGLAERGLEPAFARRLHRRLNSARPVAEAPVWRSICRYYEY